MREIPLHGKIAAGRVALVDDEDYDLVMQYRWTVVQEQRKPGKRIRGPYARAAQPRSCRPNGSGQQTYIFMHNLVTGCPMVDHVNHNTLDNQRSNLRPTSVAQNNHNQRPCIGHSSQYKGVTWHKQVGKWQATIKLNGRCRYLGVFTDEALAASTYDAAAREAYGSYAYLNFPDAEVAA